MNGPFPYNSGNYFRVGAQSAAMPEVAPIQPELPLATPPKNGAKAASSEPAQTTPPAKKYDSILNFLRNPQNQATVPPTSTGAQSAGAKSMEGPVTDPGLDYGSLGYQDPGGYIDPSTMYSNPGGYIDPNMMYSDPYGGNGGYIDPNAMYTDPYGGTGGYIDPSTMYYNPNSIYTNPYDTSMYTGAYGSQPTTGQPTTPTTGTSTAGGNTDPTKIGDNSNDTITIPSKVTDPEAEGEETNSGVEARKLLTKADDVLDLGTGTDELTIEANDRKGTIRMTDYGGTDTISIKGKNNVLTVETDSIKGQDGQSPDAVLLGGSKEDWKIEKGPDGSAIYRNEKDGNIITIKGGGQIIFQDGQVGKDPNAKTSEGETINADLKDLVDNSSSKDIASQVDMENLSESEKDYVALQYVLRMDNDFSKASEDGGWFGTADDLEDDDFSSDDWNRCIQATQAINPALAERVKQIWDNKDSITRLDGHTGSNLSRGELDSLLQSYLKGETLKSQSSKGAAAEAD
jgi:hypothetical protein